MRNSRSPVSLKGLPGFLTGVILLVLFLNILTFLNLLIPQAELEAGMVSVKSIKSPKTIYYKSKIKTKEAQDKTQEKVEKIYKLDPSISIQQRSKAEEAFKKIDEIKAGNSADKEGQIASVLSLNISQNVSSYIIETDQANWEKIKLEISRIVSDIQNKEKIKNDEKIQNEIIESRISEEFKDKDQATIKELALVLLIPNYIFSKEETDKKIEQARTDIEPVSLLIAKDEVIVNSGKVIDDLDLEKLEAVGLKKQEIFNPKTIGMVLFSLILAFLSFIYFRYFFKSPKAEKISKLKAYLIFIIFFLLTVLVFQLLTPLKPIMAYLIPISAPIMLIAILVSYESAVFSSIIFSSFFGVLTGSLELSMIYLFTSLIGIYSLRSIKRLEDIFRVGLYLAFFNFFTALTFHFTAGSFSLKTISVLLGAASVYGLGSVVLIIGTLLFWGHIFKITTLLELLELENPSQPLLKELSLKAPGTYHHSTLVSNLSEKAADDIGADALLLRVGAFYHDIGKTINPQYFIENQKRYNIHDKLKNPEQSAQIIKSHVKDGLDLAKKEKLPREIMHFIESHHGTSQILYFLAKAKQENSKIDLSQFVYEGPLPKTKEAAILMMADSVEATVRAEKNPSFKKIGEIVSYIVDSKLESGQFKEADISLKDIELLKKSFSETLATMYHKRVEYPDEKK